MPASRGLHVMRHRLLPGCSARRYHGFVRGANAAILMALTVPAALARAQPETRGTHELETWDAGDVSAAGASIPVLVYYPADGAAPAPTVIVMHGYLRNGSFHREMASTFASRGFVAIVPDMPCGVGGCDHDANAAQLAALFDWAIAEAGDAGSPISGLIDAERLGLVGHSWGGLAVHLATALDDRVRAVVLLDPNDDGGVAVDAAPSVAVPNAHLYAAVAGACNAAWEPDTIFGLTSAPKLRATIARSGHCDPEEPGDSLCAFGCGAGDSSTTPFFRRYTVAWMACFLAGDATMADWIGGASFEDDVTDGVLEGVSTEGLDAVPCTGPTPRADAGTPPGSDAGPPSEDAGEVTGTDGGGVSGDAGSSTGMDASTGPPGGEDEGGCGCAIWRGSAAGGAPALVGWVVLLLAVRRRR